MTETESSTVPYHGASGSASHALPKEKKEKSQGLALGLDLRERGPGDPRRRTHSVDVSVRRTNF
jgi:hypothetical protein